MCLSDILNTSAKKKLSVRDSSQGGQASDEATVKEHHNGHTQNAEATSSSKESEDVSNVLVKLGHHYLQVKVPLNSSSMRKCDCMLVSRSRLFWSIRIIY